MKRLIPLLVILFVSLSALPALAGEKQSFFSLTISGWDGGRPYAVARGDHNRERHVRHEERRHWRHEAREYRQHKRHHRQHHRRPVLYERVAWTPPPRFVYRNWRYTNHRPCRIVERPPRYYRW